MNSTDIKKRAQALGEKTNVDTISPLEVGGIMYDTVEYMEDVDRNGAATGIRKTYATVSAMEADKNPKGDDGSYLRRGQLASVYDQSNPSSADNGKVFSWLAPGWQLRYKLDAGYARTEMITEYNVSVLHPTEGTDGSNKYTLETAIALVPAQLRNPGVKVTFINAEGETEEDTVTWEYVGSSWNAASFTQVGANVISELEDKLFSVLDYVADFNRSFEKKGNYAVNAAGGTLALTNSTGGSWIMKNPVSSGGRIKITANDNQSILLCFLKSNDLTIRYGTNLQDSFVQGESGAREVKAGESLEYETQENTYLYIVPGTNNENVPSEMYMVPGNYYTKNLKELDKKISEVSVNIESVGENVKSNKAEIDNMSDKYTTAIGFDKFQGGTSGTDENGTYNSVPGEINAYTNGGCRVYCPDSEARKLLEAKKYSIFVKLMMTTDENNSEYNATISVSSPINIEEAVKVENVRFEELHLIKVGDFDWKDTYSSDLSVGIGILKKGANAIVEKKQVTCKWYGIYIIPTEEVKENDGNIFAKLLDYEKDFTYIAKAAFKSQHSESSENAVHSISSTKAESSCIADRVKTSLVGRIIGAYGDSLVTYIDWSPLGDYFNATAIKVGQGGGQICNNRPDVKQGFCTLERCALLPKQMALLIIYAGANDAISKRNPSTHKLEVDTELLGSMEDKPLSIADMCNYRVTASNMGTTGTAGRTGRFYQGIKTMLRNIMILFPNTQIIIATQHRYYNYINHDSDSFTDYPVLNFGNDVKRKALIEVAEEFGIPVCDLWSTCGVNDYNLRSTLVDLAGVAVHPNTGLSQRECSMFINSILMNSDKVQVEKYSPYPNYKSTNKYTQEMQEWVVDLRNEESVTPMSLTDAISLFQSTCQTNSIEIKNNMYLVFENDKSTSVGYFLTDKDNISSESSWEKWELQDIDDPNEG